MFSVSNDRLPIAQKNDFFRNSVTFHRNCICKEQQNLLANLPAPETVFYRPPGYEFRESKTLRFGS